MITRIRGQGERELRFTLAEMARWGYSGLRNTPSYRIGEHEMRGIPAINRAARIRAEALASLRLRCWRGEGPERVKIDNVWQARLFRGPANPYQTQFTFWETVGESLAYRNNAYIWKMVDPLSQRVIELWALHPDQVLCQDEDEYKVTISKGYLDPVGKGPSSYMVDEQTLIHIRGHGQGGLYEAPTAIEVYRDALTGPVGRQLHEGRMWNHGTALQVAIEFPATMNEEQAKRWRDMWKSTYEGTGGETTAVIGGGAQIKPIGMTAADARFVEMAHLTVEDASRIMGVPANLLGAPTMTGTQRANLEEDLATWFRFGLGPELKRIEGALAADEQLFGASTPNVASVYPKFDTELFVQGDVKTEADVLVSLVQAGILTPDEARGIRGLEPLPAGVGGIPQITPVGGHPNPVPMPAMPAMNGN